MYKQIKHPNLNTTDYTGWCLRFTGNAFNTKNRPFATATDAWNGAKKKHTDALPNAAVPVWFTWTGTIDGVTKNWGDVAIYVPGRGVLGTPLRGAGKSNRWDKDVATRARVIGGGAKYLGWTEDLNGYNIVEKEGNMTIPDKDNWFGRYNKAMRYIRGRNMTREEFRKNFVGRTELTMLEAMLDNKEADQFTADGDLGKVARKDKWENQIKTLKSENASLKAQNTELGKAIDSQKKEIDRLNKELALCGSDDSENLNKLGEALRWLIVRLGLK